MLQRNKLLSFLFTLVFAMYIIYYLIALHLILTRSFSSFYRWNNYMPVFGRTRPFAVKVSGRRKPGESCINPQRGSGCLVLPHLPTTAVQLLRSRSRARRSPGATSLPGGDEVYCAELLFLLWKGKEHYSNKEGSSSCSFHTGAEKWPAAKARLNFLPQVLRQD